MKPTVLVATTSPSHWFSPARLAMALANTGWNVKAICLPRHTLSKTSAVKQLYVYNGLAPISSFADAIAAARPDLIIPCDDLATRHLHNVYRSEKQKGLAGEAVCGLIERSLGAPESFPIVLARTPFMEIAREEGIRVPKTEVIAKVDELNECAVRMGFPAILKANCTSGGEGVRIVNTPAEAEHAFRVLQAPPLLARATKRALMDQDTSLIWSSLLRTRAVVNMQEYIPGREATSLVACWKGIVLASLHFEVLKKQESAGPATVLRRIENADMQSAAEKMARRLNLSGLQGFDFMLEAQTEQAYLIEINPRATQVGHLALGPGHDLPAALYAAVTGQIVQEAPKVTENDTIVLFPQEWIRNPASAYLRSGYHDVPLEEPEMVRACLQTRRKRKAWYSEHKWLNAFSRDQIPRR